MRKLEELIYHHFTLLLRKGVQVAIEEVNINGSPGSSLKKEPEARNERSTAQSIDEQRKEDTS